MFILLYSYSYSLIRVLGDGRLAVKTLPIILEIGRKYVNGIFNDYMLAVWPMTYHSPGVVCDPTFIYIMYNREVGC
jgi:Na+/H+ antiporter NhaA